MTEFARIKALGWATGERLTAAQVNAIDVRLTAILNRQTDLLLNSWQQYASSTVIAPSKARASCGVSISDNGSLGSNQIQIFHDIATISTHTVVPSVGTWGILSAATNAKNIVCAGENGTDRTKALFTCTTGYMEDLTETALPTAAAGDMVFNFRLTASSTTGYFYAYARQTGKTWSSPTGAVWTQRTTQAVTLASINANSDLYSSQGYLTIIDRTGGNQCVVYYSTDHGVTWSAAVNVGTTGDGAGTLGEPMAIGYSTSLGVWIYALRGGVTFTAPTPAGAWTKINSTAAADSIRSTVILDDGLICGILERAAGGVNVPGIMLVYSYDLGLTWKAVSIQNAESADTYGLMFDGCRLWLHNVVTAAIWRSPPLSVIPYQTLA